MRAINSPEITINKLISLRNAAFGRKFNQTAMTDETDKKQTLNLTNKREITHYVGVISAMFSRPGPK